MSTETLFSLLNLSVMPAWILLILAPNSKLTNGLVHSMIYPIILGTAYGAAIIASLFFGMGSPEAGFFSIAQVRAIFSTDIGILAGWAHYLVFDLFIGAWIARDGARRGVKHLVLIPCLIGCFMFGPIGLLLYAVLRRLTKKGGRALEIG